MRRVTILATLTLTACATPQAPASVAGLAPTPPGVLAFCQAHGATCDPIPPARAMPDAGPALTPVAWADYCRRGARDTACRR